MSGLMGLLQLGKRSLSAQQFGQQVVGNNISNVNTEGYSRQAPRFNTGGSIDTPWGKIGLGVQIGGIVRSRDVLLDKMFRQAESNLNEWETKETYLRRIDLLFREDDENGIGSRLDSFFNAWQDLANDPESVQARIAVKEQAKALISTFKRASSTVREQREGLNENISDTVKRINKITRQIALLNRKTQMTPEGAAGQAYDVFDQRDRLLDELSSLADITVVRRANAAVSVYIDSINVVEGVSAQELTTVEANDGNMRRVDVVGPQGSTLNPSGGYLHGLLELRDQTLKGYEQQLNQLSRHIVEEVNKYHKVGYTLAGETGINFFDNRYINANDLRLSEDVLNDPKKIIAATEDAAGDNAQALRIAALKDMPLVDGTSFRDFYASLITTIGSDARYALDSAKNYDVIKSQTLVQRESISGVSLDEEMVDMIRYEQAYNAAARMIATLDEMIQTIIALK